LNKIDMRGYARSVGVSVRIPAGSAVFTQGDGGDCLYIVQSGTVEMIIGESVVEVCGPNEIFGFMSLIDGSPRSSTAQVKEDAELSVIDKRRFRFMVDEVPYFALYIMGAMARRIRGMGRAM
jgi:CRP/FNR family transcriptional regulator, cyclic AMP receptor protein